MGTSKSYGGPGDKPPLLPDWALPPPEGGDPLPEEEEQEEEETQPDIEDSADHEAAEPDSDEDDEAGGDDDVGGIEQGPAVPLGSWRSAKTLFGKAVKKNGDKQAFRKAAQSYVRAHGGSRRAAQTATAGRSATARLGGFLSDVATRGLNAALEAINLSSVIGKDPRTVFAAIANAIAPDGSSPEKAVAREATNDVLADFYERFVTDDDLSRLNSLTSEDVKSAILDSVTCYIYHRWLQELGRQIEEKTMSSSEAVRLERETKLFVKDSVTVDFKDKDPLTMDWASDGSVLVERIFSEAYSLFGAGR